MDPADDLYFLVNSFEEIQVGGGNTEDRPYLSRSQVSIYVADALARMVNVVTQNTISFYSTSSSSKGPRSNTTTKPSSNSSSARPSKKNASNSSASGSRPTSRGKLRPWSRSRKGKRKVEMDVDSDGNEEQGEFEEEDDDTEDVDTVQELASLEALGNLKDPIRFLQMYFELAAKGLHVVNADFAFVFATGWNKVCFLRVIANAIKHMDPRRLVSVDDFLQLVRLYCPDLPKDLIQLCHALITAPSEERLQGQRTTLEPQLDEEEKAVSDVIVEELDQNSQEVLEEGTSPTAQATTKRKGELVSVELSAMFYAFTSWLMFGDFFTTVFDQTRKAMRGAQADKSQGEELPQELLLLRVTLKHEELERVIDDAIFWPRHGTRPLRPPVHLLRKVQSRIQSEVSPTLATVFQALLMDHKAIMNSLHIDTWTT